MLDYSEDALQAVREGRLLINRYDEWLFDEFKPYLGQRILEVGCGLGNLLGHFLERALVVGIETSSESVDHVRRQYANNQNVQAHKYSITDPEVLKLAGLGFDTAVSLNVFEHIRDDELALRHTLALLQPGGALILIVPSHQSLYGTMDSSIGHYRRYTKDSMQEKMEQVGFQVQHQKYINILGALGWWLNGRVLKKTVPPSGQLRFFNQLVPVLRTFESLFDSPFGISLLTVAKKAG